jgi:chemotaxis signal transduction protein
MGIIKDNLEGMEGLLIFNIGGKEFCTNILHLNAIIKINEAKFNEHNHFKDEVFYSGQFFRMIDIKEILNCPSKEFTNDSRIILFESSGKLFGFIADKIIEIVTLDSIFRKKHLRLIPSTELRYICGRLAFMERSIFLLNMEILSNELNSLKKIIPWY